jgi:hypothetical protein
VALHGLGEEGARGAAANKHHPRLLPRRRHRRSRTLAPSRAPHPVDKLPHPLSSRGVTNESSRGQRWRLYKESGARRPLRR